MTKILEIKVDVAPVAGVLERMRQRLDDATPGMRLIGNVVVSSVLENFETGSSPSGQTWPPSKRVLKQGGQTLVDTGELRNSVGMEASPDRVVIYAAREYAAIQQYGGVIKRQAKERTVHFKTFKRGRNAGKTLFSSAKAATKSILAKVGAYSITIPARPYLGVKERDWPNITTLLLRYLGGAVSG
jgi:phage gpG-like protein